MITPVLVSGFVQLVVGFLFAYALARFIHKMSFNEWLNARLGPPSNLELLLTLGFFVVGILVSFGAVLLVM